MAASTSLCFLAGACLGFECSIYSANLSRVIPMHVQFQLLCKPTPYCKKVTCWNIDSEKVSLQKIEYTISFWIHHNLEGYSIHLNVWYMHIQNLTLPIRFRLVPIFLQCAILKVKVTD